MDEFLFFKTAIALDNFQSVGYMTLPSGLVQYDVTWMSFILL